MNHLLHYQLPNSFDSPTVNFPSMAASQVSGMKMRTLLFGVILGLLAVVHSTPIDTVTEILAKSEDEVIREAETDGFLVENLSPPSVATESPETNATVQASQQPTADSKESVEIEGSGGETSDEATTFMSLPFGTTTVSHALSSASTVLPMDVDNSSSVSAATQSPPSSSTSVPNEAQPSPTPASQTTDSAVSTYDFLSIQSSDSGSGDKGDEMFGQYSTTTTSSSMTSSSNAETSTASTTSTTSTTRQNVPVVFPEIEGSGKVFPLEDDLSSVSITTGNSNLRMIHEEPLKEKAYENKTEPSTGNGTPGWMIIVGFIVGLAALVMLLVAIATRDRWNGPSRASQIEDTTNSSNQQRELEMETFLQKDIPKENGHGAEYTVIPLEELPEKCSSH